MAYYRVPTTNKVIQMLDKRGRLEKVIDLVSSLPASPAEGDRYIDLTDNKVKEWNGSAWDEYTPKDGDNLYVLNKDKYYYFNGSEWKDVTEISSYWEKEEDTLKPKNASNVEITGSFIGDGSQLTGIKKLIEEFVAQGNVTAGDVVAFVNGKVKKGKIHVKNSIVIGEEYQASIANDLISATSLDENTVVISFRENEDTHYRGSVVVAKKQNGSWVFGSKIDITSYGVGNASIDTIDETHVLVAFGKCGLYVLEVSGFDVTIVSSLGYTGDYGTCLVLDRNHFVSATGNADLLRYGTIGSDYSLTILDTEDITSDTVWKVRLRKILNTSFVVCYHNHTNGSVELKKYNIENDNIVYTGLYKVYNYDTEQFDFDINGDNLLFGVYNNSMDNVYLYLMDDNFNDIDSTIIDNDVIDIAIEKIGSDFVVSYRKSDNSSYMRIVGVTSSIVLYSEYQFATSYRIGDLSVIENKIFAVTTERSYFSLTENYREIDTLSYIGISQETKSDGETVKVLIQGLSDVHSGLTIGQKYYATPEGDLTTDETEDYLGLAIAEDKLLLMDWQRPIMLYDENNDEYVIPE